MHRHMTLLYYKQTFMTTKNIIITALAAVAAIAQAAAQGAIGSIKIHPAFGNNITRIIDTGSMIYYLSDKNLYSYDKDNDESDHYSRNNRLNGSLVRDIYYNYDRNYLAVAYDDANIDILTDDGATINLPDIYNADLQAERTINDITFADGRMLVATSFGFVVFNDERYEVEFSRILNTDIKSVAATDDYLWVNADNLYFCNLDAPAQTLAEMTATTLHEDAKLLPRTSADNAIFFAGGWTYNISVDENGTYSIGLIASESMAQLQPTQNGYIAINSGRTKLLYIDEYGHIASTYNLPAEDAQQALVSSMESKGQVWELSTAGLRHIQLGQSGEITVLSDYFHPNATSVKRPVNVVFDNSSNSLLISNNGPTLTSPYDTELAHINILRNGSWEEVLPNDIIVTNPKTGEYLRNYNIYHPIFNPYDGGYFFGTLYEGAYQIKENGEIIKYDTSNSPMAEAKVYDAENTVNIASLQFDASGNLWMLQSGNAPSPVIVLPHDKVQNSSVTKSDWIDVNVSVSHITHSSYLYITKRHDIKIITEDQYNGNIYFINDNGNPASTSIQSVPYTSGRIPDQDGIGFEWRYIYCFAEDLSGNLWMGTGNGPVYLNPANAFGSNLSLTRPRIPRNDGTNYADNLLDGIPVSAIAVDGSNRKWIGTVSNGLYLVNEDGSKVLLHYTTDNSPLPSNTIYSVCCATNSNSVFAGTDAGLVEIFSDASQPSQDYSNVYAYPNPVRPGFSGNIAIVGLMDNSLVKIADSSGNVVRSLQSLGGTATWDGCNSAGKRVKTGVYFVMVSQSDGSSSSGKVATKILFVN